MDPNDSKTTINIFWRTTIGVPHTITPGRTTSDRSVRIVDAVEKYDSATMELMPEHWPSPVQFADTGLHSSRMPTKVATKVLRVRPSSERVAFL